MSATSIAPTPEPPYYAVIFTSRRTDGDRGYGHMAERMVELAAQQPGFLGVESVRAADGLGITVSYWSSQEAILAWKAQTEHRSAQATGQRIWYADYQVRIARVERDYGSHSGGALTAGASTLVAPLFSGSPAGPKTDHER